MTALREGELDLAPEEYLTPEEYLAFEEESPVRHEYANGYVYAMAGGTWEHNMITTNILVHLGVQLKGTPCIPIASNRRLRIRPPGETFYYYPDVTVDCTSNRNKEAEDATVIFEVLSTSTRRIDDREKLLNYLNLHSMRVYALVDQQRAHVTVHRRSAEGAWVREVITDLDATLPLPEIGCTLPLRTIYDRLPFAEGVIGS